MRLAALTTAVLENGENPQAYLTAGVRGIVHRDVPNQELLRCIRQVTRCETYVQRRAAELRLGLSPIWWLSACVTASRPKSSRSSD